MWLLAGCSRALVRTAGASRSPCHLALGLPQPHPTCILTLPTPPAPARLSNVRVPRDALLDRYATVRKKG